MPAHRPPPPPPLPPPPTIAPAREASLVLPAPAGVLAPAAGEPHRQALRLFLARYAEGVSRQTAQSGLARLARLAAELAGQPAAVARAVDPAAFPWGALRAEHASLLARRVIDSYAPATARHLLAFLRGILVACSRTRGADGAWLLSAEELAVATDFPRVRGRRPPAGRRLEQAQVQALFTAASSAPTEAARARDRALVAIGYCLGLRRAEIAGLLEGDYDRADGTLEVRGKGGKVVRMALPPGVAPELDAWLALRCGAEGAKGAPDATAPLLTRLSRAGELEQGPAKPLSTTGVADIVRRLAARAGLGHLTPHDLRRTCGRHVYERQGLLAAKEWLRHEQVSTTAIYADEPEAERRKAAAVMGVPSGTPVAPPAPPGGKR